MSKIQQITDPAISSKHTQAQSRVSLPTIVLTKRVRSKHRMLEPRNTSTCFPTQRHQSKRLMGPKQQQRKTAICGSDLGGTLRNFEDNTYEASVEVYYKNMQNLIDYANGADLQLNPNVEALLRYGKGWSYGVEMLIRKKYGQFSGWIAYTFSRTRQQFADINNGQPYPATQDRPNDISIVTIYDYSPKWTFSAVWVYYTGNAVTFPSGDYFIDNRLIPLYTERNGYRMPAYTAWIYPLPGLWGRIQT